MYVHFRSLPWYSLCEFRNVAQQISCDDFDDLVECVRLMQVWLIRANMSMIPRAIICTYELLLAKVQRSTPALALAVMRFISLVSSEDQDRSRGGFAIPVYSLARQAGLPAWMSDLRNDIAHGSVPSELAIRKAAEYALQWVMEFWRKNSIDTTNQCVCRNRPPIDHFDLSIFPADKTCLGCLAYAVRQMARYLASRKAPAKLSPTLRTYFNFLRNRQLINHLVLAVVNLLPDDRATAWAEFFLCAYNRNRTGHPLAEYLSDADINTFPWRHCLEIICLSLSVKTDDLAQLVFAAFHSDLPAENQVPFVRLSNAPGTEANRKSAIQSSPWTLDRTIQWWRVPLGEILDISMSLTYFYSF